MSKPVVVDISAYQPHVDFAVMAKSGIVGIIHKASQGTGSVDHTYAEHRKQAIAAGMLWGAYHFMDMTDPAKQAAHFLDAAAPDNNTLVCLDWENVPPSNRAPNPALAKQFLDAIQKKLGRKAVIYSGNVAKERLNGIDAYFAAHRLWLCQYAAHFTTQASWNNEPWLWQNNGDNFGPGPHRIPGYDGIVDNSCIVGSMTIDRLKSEWAS